MIDQDYRFSVISATVYGPEHVSTVMDWDQRRCYTISGSTTFMPPDEDLEIGFLKRHINHLAPNVRSITIDDKGLLVTVSSDPEDDATLAPHYPRYSSVQSLQDCPTIELSKLTELDRFSPRVDLMSYVDEDGVQRKVAFKYTITFQWRNQIWDEMHVVKSIPAHPNIVPFDHIVIDPVESRVVGFTTTFIPGGTLDSNKTRVFRLEWLQQLTNVVDYLNLELGIIHQDIAPRNLLIDPATNNLRLFDFDRAARVGKPGVCTERDDIVGVIFTLYEIITQDEHYREVCFEQRDVETVHNLEVWPVKTELDCDVSLFRKHLNCWVQSRRARAAQNQPAETTVDVPDMPPSSPLRTGYDDSGEPILVEDPAPRRTEALQGGKNVMHWERAPYEQAYGQECVKNEALQ
ncbi:Uncharacterized protein BP5553_09389 [Venustampulla echinocandica]|uniref:EKC/KEOPS complex subunit BUD32 n=1 Tax=Venustampulla echinocandica TaxID=2656787 RepID=A0A370TCK1_9HELO|nr:Uncharacterized protein BP5553_09389 [Venustampulla echinocandica]RDL31987.1 Uncharacterized protein BP5553_09389 [Venustampulla echinocandica]